MHIKNDESFSRTLFTKDIINRLRMDIILGKLPHGSRIIETHLAEELGVSRGPIRTALQVLIQEGLVERLSNGGTKVVGYTIKDAKDMFDFRLMLEKKALELILNNSLVNYHPLLNVIDILDETNKKESIDKLTDNITTVDIQFHRSILIMSENNPMLMAWNTMANVWYTILNITNTTYDTFYDYYVSHKELANLIIQRDPMCIENLEDHIKGSKDILIDRLSKLIK